MLPCQSTHVVDFSTPILIVCCQATAIAASEIRIEAGSGEMFGCLVCVKSHYVTCIGEIEAAVSLVPLHISFRDHPNLSNHFEVQLGMRTKKPGHQPEGITLLSLLYCLAKHFSVFISGPSIANPRGPK